MFSSDVGQTSAAIQSKCSLLSCHRCSRSNWLRFSDGRRPTTFPLPRGSKSKSKSKNSAKLFFKLLIDFAVLIERPKDPIGLNNFERLPLLVFDDDFSDALSGVHVFGQRVVSKNHRVHDPARDTLDVFSVLEKVTAYSSRHGQNPF